MKKLNGFSTGSVLLASAVGLLLTSFASAQHQTGMTVLKSCPVNAAAGSTFQCTFSIRNEDRDHGIINLSVTNTVPYPGGTTSAVSCEQSGIPVTTLGPRDSATDTCSGVASETAPACGSTDTMLQDEIRASGFDEGIPTLPVNGSTIVAVVILACTPTPAPPTATPTPTVTPTPTITPTPTHGAPPLPTQAPPQAGRPTPKPTKTPKP